MDPHSSFLNDVLYSDDNLVINESTIKPLGKSFDTANEEE